MAETPGSLRYMDSLPPPPDDGQRYLLTYSFLQSRPAWLGLAGFGFSYGNNFGGGL